MTIRIAMWSGPRNISTAMMRAWENRPDTEVVDEPLYAAYLERTGLDHPGRDQVLRAQSRDEAEVIARLHGPVASPVLYVKHMTHHLRAEDDLTWVRSFRNVLLIRQPAEVVASYVKAREACEPEDIGLLQQVRLLEVLADDPPPVIDAGDFLRDPEAHLRWLCEWLGIAFTPAMLHWPAGPRESDGVWAPHWYSAVQASTGFEPWRPRDVDLSAHHAAVAEATRPAYELLHALRLVL